MRKIFTLFAVASVACAVNAQTTETFECFEADGTTLKPIFVANPDASQMSVVDMSTPNLKAELTSGPVAGYDQGPLPLVAKYDNGFNQTQAPGQKNNPTVKKYPDPAEFGFNFVQGKGNPVNLDKVGHEELKDEGGVPTGEYRADWTNSYYQPDGSAGMPLNGTYAKFTPAFNGELSVLCWANKGNRLTYVVKQSDMKALTYGKDVIASGWVKGTNYGEELGADFAGFPMYQDTIPTANQLNAAAGKEPVENGDYIIGAGNQVAVVYLTFDVVANETYWIFQQSSQIAVNSYSYTYTGGAGINDITVDENAPVEYFNLQGIRVANPENGLYIRRQGKNVSKVIL